MDEERVPPKPSQDKPPSREEAVRHVTEAHRRLKDMREKQGSHPELEEAIRSLESALNILTIKTAGLL